jgi:hypothetical protein
MDYEKAYDASLLAKAIHSDTKKHIVQLMLPIEK